jgi:hypothetical protein
MSGLRTYRFLFLGVDSYISSAQVIACADDDAAKLRAREILGQRPDYRAIEVWELDRRVHVQSDVAAL